METFSGIGKFIEEKGPAIEQITGQVTQVAGAVAEFRAERAFAETAREIAEYNADQFAEQAKVAIRQGSFEARRLLRLARITTAANIAAVGATGGLLTGSKLVAIADTEAEFEREARETIRNAELEERRFLSFADVELFAGREEITAANVRARVALLRGIRPAFQLAGALAAKLNRKPRIFKKPKAQITLSRERTAPVQAPVKKTVAPRVTLPAKLRRTNVRLT